MGFGIGMLIGASLGCSLGYVLGAIMRTGKHADITEQNLQSALDRLESEPELPLATKKSAA
jgi:NhaP-type Na+/H+ or K+/H+ antiporter